MKKTYKKISLLLAVLFLLGSLASCIRKKADPDVTLSTQDLANYTVIYPTKASQTLKTAIGAFTAKVKEIYGVTLLAKEDFYREGVEGTEILPNEILIGSTNREESATLTSAFRANDYGYKIINGKLVISGICEETDAMAIESFISKVLSAKDETVFFSNNKNAYSFIDNYDLETIQLNGKDISSYRIVYSVNHGTVEPMMAELLQRTIADKCGVLLSVVKDSFSPQENEILIGTTNRLNTAPKLEEQYRFEILTNGHLSITGGSATAVYYGAKEVANLIANLTSQTFNLERTTKSTPEETVTVMSWNLCGQHAFTTSRMNGFVSNIKAQLPDVVFLEEAKLTDSERNTILTGLGSSYANAIQRKTGEPSGYYNMLNKEMYYNKDVLNLLWSDYFWVSDTPDEPSTFPHASDGNRDSNVACFERKSDGKQFIVISFHPEWTTTQDMIDHGLNDKSMRAKQFEMVQGKIAEYKARNPQAAVIFGGDFNAKRGDSSENMFAKLAQAGFVDAGVTAFDIQDGPTYPGANSVIDFIFGEKDKVLFTSYEAVQLGRYVNEKTNPGTNPADHNPVVAKFIFK